MPISRRCWWTTRARCSRSRSPDPGRQAGGAGGGVLLLEFGDDGEMIRWPDAVHRGGSAQPGRLDAAAALPVWADQDVVDPRIRDDAAGLIAVAAIPGEAGIAGIGVAPRVDEHQ